MLSRKLVSLFSNRCRVGLNNVVRYNSVGVQSMPDSMTEVKLKIQKKLGIQSSYSPLLNSREYLLKYEPKPEDCPPRSMQDSFISAVIPLSTDDSLRERYVTFLGHIRLGRLMEDMDLFAVWVVHQHLKVLNHPEDVPLPFTFVTVLVDKISFTDFIPTRDSDIRLSGHVSWVGRSSVEVVVWLEQMCNHKWCKLTRALFLMASRNATNTKALMVNPLVPANEEEQIIFTGGESRKKRRSETHKKSLFTAEPNAFEQKLIHDLFVKTIDMKNMAFNQRILPPGSIWMEDALLSNIVFSHPEDRNAHNTVFGGFLMRHALELSWALAFQVSGNQRPKLEHISDISFNRSVEVSSFMKMNGYLIYTEMNYMQIVVIAEVFDPSTGAHHTSNMFYYTYSILDRVPKVLPRTYHEAMWYLDGRRHFQNTMNLDDTPEHPFQTIQPPTFE